MSYQVKHTETNNPAKPSITVQDQTLNTETSLTFVGKNYAGYAPIMAENFLHLLENFAKNTAPPAPVEGQLWYDNSADINLLKVYDGTEWTAAGSVKKQGTAPAAGIKGDLWVNTDTQQLHVYSGSNWLLIGPQYSSGLKTGPDIEVIVDTENVDRTVLSLYSANQRVAVVSGTAFTPKTTIPGFPTIGQGINIYSADTITKVWGTASQADALNINNIAIPAVNFLRSDIASISNAPLSLRSNAGLSVGSDLSFNIGTESNIAVFYSKNNGNSIAFRLNNNGQPVTAVTIDAQARIGLGPDNTNPQETLDVAGNAVVDGTVTISGLTTSNALDITTTSTFGDDITAYGQTFVNYLDSNGDPKPGSVILPGSDTANGVYDIGTATRKFRNIYANQFIGNFNGAFTGSLSGSISGSAAKLSSPTVFKMQGDVTSDNLSFDGQSTNGQAVFTTTISQDIITNKTEVTDSLLNDQILIYRSGTNSGLKKMSKASFISNIATVPIGAMMPFAGATPPTGYLLCDGSEVLIGSYPDLFSVIGYTYKKTGFIGKNTFALPDLRGRFPLGMDSMDNGQSIPSILNDKVLVDAGGGSANRVTSTTADNLGEGAGREEQVLGVENLPDHKHNLNSGNAQYYASGLPNAPADGAAVAGYGLPNSSTGSGLPNSGGVIDTSSKPLSTPVSTMNPYLTINYIIFTGKLA